MRDDAQELSTLSNPIQSERFAPAFFGQAVAPPRNSRFLSLNGGVRLVNGRALHTFTQRESDMRFFRSFGAAVAAMLLLGSGVRAQAAFVCVSNTTQLSQALSAAQNDGQTDEIRIQGGNYLLTSELQYISGSGKAYGLILKGGYPPGCNSSAGSDSTVLDGQGLTRILSINSSGEVGISKLTFVNGYAAHDSGGAIRIGANGTVTIYHTQFAGNQVAESDGAGGAIWIFAPDIDLRDNLLIGNFAADGGAAFLASTGTSYLTNNTIVGNQLGQPMGLTGGVDITSHHAYLSNNILWNNELCDVFDHEGYTDYANNDIGSLHGMDPLTESSDLKVDPEFDGLRASALHPFHRSSMPALIRHRVSWIAATCRESSVSSVRTSTSAPMKAMCCCATGLSRERGNDRQSCPRTHTLLAQPVRFTRHRSAS